MPSPKSGNPLRLVSPATPRAALEADVADPGVVSAAKASQAQTQSGKYGSIPVKPFKPSADAPSGAGPGGANDDPAKPKGWIEINAVDATGEPVAGEAYRVTLPDGETVAEGTLDANGHARIEGFEPGSCKITFPRRDKSTWKPK